MPPGWQVMGEGKSSEEAPLTREKVIIPPPRVAYHVGDESLDTVCTSLDGPLCKAEEKAHTLAVERERAARAADHQHRMRSRPGAGAAQQAQGPTTVKTVKEFKFEKGKEVGGKIETQVKRGGDEEADTPLVILKHISDGDDLNEIASQVQAGIADALRAWGREVKV
jgi:hypothetical protein